jgi:hypothetical protein
VVILEVLAALEPVDDVPIWMRVLMDSGHDSEGKERRRERDEDEKRKTAIVRRRWRDHKAEVSKSVR